MNTRYAIAFVCVVALTLYSCNNSSSKKQEPSTPQEPLVNDLPNMVVTLLDGTTVDFRQLKEKTVLIIFRPNCDHCEREAIEIENNLEAFGDNALYFITSDPMPEIEKFAIDHSLNGRPNVFFGWTSIESVLNNFGSVATPSIYVYSREHKLVKSFNGEVPISQVLPHV